MKLFVVVVVLSVFVSGGGGPVSFRGCEGGRGASQLWSKLFVVVVVLSVFVLGGGGPVSFGVVLSCSAGNGGESASGGRGGRVSFGVGCETVRRRRRAVCFCFGAGGGPVSFRAAKGE